MPNKDTHIDDERAIKLPENCFNACETLKVVLRGKNPGDFSESENMAMASLEGYVDYCQSSLCAMLNNPRVMRGEIGRAHV